jgi:hypothetical protein
MNPFDQRGVVSILAVSLTSILISVVTIAVVSQMSGELRQATDATNRVAAQYAAESGTADALAYLKAGLADGTFLALGLPNQTCASSDAIKTLTVVGGIDPAITCREVITSGTAQGTLQKDGTVQYDLSDTTILDGGSLELNWDEQRNPTAALPRSFTSQPGVAGTTSGSGSNTWDGPPALEITVAYRTAAAPNDPVNKTIYLLPKCCDGAATPPPPLEESFNQIWSDNDTGTIIEPDSYPVLCHASTLAEDYDCSIYLPGGNLASYLPPVTGTTQYVLRIKALGSGGDYQMTLFGCGDPSGCQSDIQPLALTNATIDVTAQVGGAYQRVVETPPVRSNPLGSTSYAVLGTDNICKDLKLINEGASGYTPQFYADCPAQDNNPPSPPNP